MSRNSSTKFYQEHIERLQKKAHEIYQSLSEISKSFWRRKKKRQYGCHRFKNLSEDEKQNPV